MTLAPSTVVLTAMVFATTYVWSEGSDEPTERELTSIVESWTLGDLRSDASFDGRKRVAATFARRLNELAYRPLMDCASTEWSSSPSTGFRSGDWLTYTGHGGADPGDPMGSSYDPTEVTLHIAFDPCVRNLVDAISREMNASGYVK